MSGLLEPTYDVPSTGESSFMKFVKGENRFRILGTPVMGYQYWQDDRTPVRIKTAGEAPAGEKPKHFWQIPVWDGHSIKVLDVTQSTVQKQLTELDRNSEWGNLTDYDVIVTRSGDGMDTTYTTTPCPKAPITEEVKGALADFKKTYEPNKVFESTPTAEGEEELPF